jgi:hypothetical protein
VSIVYNCCWSSPAQVQVPRDSCPHFTVLNSRLFQPRGPGPRIYIPQEHAGPIIPPGTGFPFRRLLRLAGLWWRYSTPPPLSRPGVLVIQPRDGPNRKHHPQQFFYCCVHVLCSGNMFTEQLPSNSPCIVDVFTGRYQTTHAPSRDRCIATILHATIYQIISNNRTDYYSGKTLESYSGGTRFES